MGGKINECYIKFKIIPFVINSNEIKILGLKISKAISNDNNNNKYNNLLYFPKS